MKGVVGGLILLELLYLQEEIKTFFTSNKISTTLKAIKYFIFYFCIDYITMHAKLIRQVTYIHMWKL